MAVIIIMSKIVGLLVLMGLLASGIHALATRNTLNALDEDSFQLSNEEVSSFQH